MYDTLLDGRINYSTLFNLHNDIKLSTPTH